MLKAKDISKSYSGKDILSNVSFTISNNQKIGLVGKNGAGKSTLIKILAGIVEPTSGTVEFSGDVSEIGYLKQEFEKEDMSKTVSYYIDEVTGIKSMQEELEKLENSDLTDEVNFARYSELQEEFIALDGYNFDFKKQITLSGLNIDSKFLNQKISTLSGGQKSKVLLCVVLLKKADLLLLDEPTNNLDLSSIEWLEKYIASLDVSCVVISHDRKFLDTVVSKIIEIDCDSHNIHEYTGGYTDYISFKDKALNKQIVDYEKQQETISEMNKSIAQKKKWANAGRYQGVSDKDKLTRGYVRDRASSSASSAKNLENKLKKMKKIEKPIIHDPLNIDINLANEAKATVYMSFEDLVCGYEDGFKVNVGSFYFEYGDRILLLGNNGTGKTTFIKTLLGNINQISGTVTKGTNVKVGKMLQEEYQGMIEGSSATVEEYLLSNLKCDKSLIFATMNRFNFDYEDRLKKIDLLSVQEKELVYICLFAHLKK